MCTSGRESSNAQIITNLLLLGGFESSNYRTGFLDLVPMKKNWKVKTLRPTDKCLS